MRTSGALVRTHVARGAKSAHFSWGSAGATSPDPPTLSELLNFASTLAGGTHNTRYARSPASTRRRAPAARRRRRNRAIYSGRAPSRRRGGAGSARRCARAPVRVGPAHHADAQPRGRPARPPGHSQRGPDGEIERSPTVMGRYVAGAARGGSAGAPERHGRSHRCQGRLPSELSRLPSPG